MTKKYCTLAGWLLFVPCILAVGAEKGYGDDLYKASLTGSSLSSYEREVEGKISIKDNGKIDLSIKELRTSRDYELVTQSSELVIEAEVNDSAKTYKFPFEIADGNAEETFTLQNLKKKDKIEIISVTINKSTSTIPTPTVAASPTSSPTATPTVTASPSPTVTPTGTGTSSIAAVAQIFNASTTSGDTIMVPGGIISESTTGATPTPTVTASPTPGASPTSSPEVIEATKVSIKPETINLKSKGTFKAFITLPSPYSGDDVRENTVVCEGAPVFDNEVDGTGRYIATFKIQELDLESEIKIRRAAKDKKTETTFTVTGELKDGKTFQGSTKVKIKGKEKGKKHDDENNNEGDHGKKSHH